jgi:hypothetical protein
MGRGIRWYEAGKNMLEEHLDKDFTILISCFIFNFPNNSILKLTPENHLNSDYIQIICFTLYIILSHTLVTSPMSVSSLMIMVICSLTSLIGLTVCSSLQLNLILF